MPVYIAAGVGLTICIRVYEEKSARSFISTLLCSACCRTLSKSIGYMTECSWYCIRTWCRDATSTIFLLPRSLRMRLRPCWPPGRGSVGGTHSCCTSDEVLLDRTADPTYSYSSGSGTIGSCAAICPGWATMESTVAGLTADMYHAYSFFLV